MIQKRIASGGADDAYAGPRELDRGIVFCTLWTTGPDTALDGLFRICAAGQNAEGAWESFDRHADPFPERAGGDGRDTAAATARMAREFGVRGADLVGAPAMASAWEDFRVFAGARVVVVPDSESFDAWQEHLDGQPVDAKRAPVPLDVVGLAEVAALLLPGRLANRREDLVAALVGDAERDAPRALRPLCVRAALAALVGRFLGHGTALARLVATGYAHAYEDLSTRDAFAARRLALALEIADRPSLYRADPDSLLPADPVLQDGALRDFFMGAGDIDEQLDQVRPRCSTAHPGWLAAASLPPARDDPTPFDPGDLRLVDDVFQVHLPALFDAERADSGSSYRRTQHDVAREVARTLGSDELLLVHAPTGTGKTLSYLVPALLWARRHAVRLGVATYTRALQEQAMDREVPRALAALARASTTGEETSPSHGPGGFLVSSLKGRENYLCWRALQKENIDLDDGDGWLVWCGLVLFALTDLEGDLDRLPRRPPLRLSDPDRYRDRHIELLRGVRARTGCCTHPEDRTTCAAEVARRRAERSHVVITNQSFALSRQQFFRHLIFDECEHLHSQAHNAWSKTLSFGTAHDVLTRLRPDRTGASSSRGRPLLDRIEERVVPGTSHHRAWQQCVASWQSASLALSRLQLRVVEFEEWRVAQRADVDEEPSLLRRFAESEEGAELIAARQLFVAVGNELDASLAETSEHLDRIGGRGLARLRREIGLVRGDLADVLSVVESWMPLNEGRPAYRPETFYDVDRDWRRRTSLAARVLLPNEYLGRSYYPGLRNGVFLSASTWIRGSFDSALGYLGLDRAAEPHLDEERPGRTVRTFKADEVFDYSRVLVSVPRDVPSIRSDKSAFLDYVARFVRSLGERTRGRMLVLFTNAADVRTVGRDVEDFFRERRIPVWYQGMQEAGKEEISELFRSRVDSILMGVDTFWYGADFPGETLEYLVIVRLPYGVPDRYHHAQCAVLGQQEQRRRIYLPRALAKFRQGFGRLMRKTSDRGCVFLLDGRVLAPQNRMFLRELPLAPETEGGARFVRAETDRCLHEALAHMGMLADVRRRGLGTGLQDLERDPPAPRQRSVTPPSVNPEDLPF